MEFFEDPKNWGKTEIRCGRSWKKEELRIKSNVDLHKLWYVSYESLKIIFVSVKFRFSIST